MGRPTLKQKRKLGQFTSERQNLQGPYTHDGAAHGSVRNLVKANNLRASKVRQVLHSKPYYTKFTLATSEFNRMKTSSRFKNKFRCPDFAYVDKLDKYINGEKYLLVRQHLCDRTVDA